MIEKILLDKNTNTYADFKGYAGFSSIENALIRSNLYDCLDGNGTSIIAARDNFLFAHFLDMWYLIALSHTGFACIGKQNNVYLLDGIIHKEQYNCNIAGCDEKGIPIATLPYLFTEKTTYIIFPGELYHILINTFSDVAIYEYRPDCTIKDVTETAYGQTYLSLLFASMLSVQVEPRAFPFLSFLPESLAMSVHCIKKEDARIETIDPFTCEARLHNGNIIKKSLYHVNEPISSMYPFITPDLDNPFGEPAMNLHCSQAHTMEHAVYNNIIDFSERKGRK